MTLKLGGGLKSLVSKIGQAIGSFIAVVVTFVTAALVACLPLAALPGELQTDFVTGSWIIPVGGGALGLALTVRLRPLAQQEGQPWWPSTLRSMWRFFSTFVAFFWLAGALLWLNAYGVKAGRTHDMLVVGYEERTGRPGGSTINHYKLSEIGRNWRADLQPTYERASFLKVGACVRIIVHQGRLGLDWIGDAHPIECHT